MSRKTNQVTATQIQQILTSCRFNPLKPGPMKVIAQIDNLAYFEGKVHELIAEAGRARLEEQDTATYLDNLRKSIQVLSLCIATVENQEKKIPVDQ